MKKHFIIIVYIILFLSPGITAQIPFQIDNFSISDYHGGIQNWGITVNNGKNVFCGNSEGLLRYNGNDWQMMSPGGSFTVHAVACVGDRIYAAGKNNIGYFKKNDVGEYIYNSLRDSLKTMGITSIDFWNIAVKDNKIYFHSYSDVVMYDGSKFIPIYITHFTKGVFLVEDKVLLHDNDGILYELEDNRKRKFSDNHIFTDRDIRFVTKSDDGYLFCFSDGSIYNLNKGVVAEVLTLRNAKNNPVVIDCGDMINGHLALGTIGDGVFIVNIKTKESFNFGNNYLQDQNVHGICCVDYNHIWLSLDCGVAVVRINPEVFRWKTIAEIGTFFDATHFNGQTYIATNRGLVKFPDGDFISVDYYPLKFEILHNQLLCGSTSYLHITGEKSSDVIPCNGVEQFCYITDKQHIYSYIRSYQGISLLNFENNKWKLKNSLRGQNHFDHIHAESLNIIWGINYGEEIVRMCINANMETIDKIERFDHIDGNEISAYIGIFQSNNQSLFVTRNGVYSYNVSLKKFHKEEQLTKEFPALETLQCITTSSNHELWIATNEEILLYNIHDMSVKLQKKWSIAEFGLMRYNYRANIATTEDSLVYIGTNQGTVVIDRRNQRHRANKNTSPYIESVSYGSSPAIFVAIKEGEIHIPYHAKHITVSIANDIASNSNSISYFLEGESEKWSKWQNTGKIEYTQLASGSYTLHVKSGNDKMASMKIIVDSPWYFKWWMILFYCLLFMLTIGITVRYISKRKLAHLKAQLDEQNRLHKEELRIEENKRLQEKVNTQQNELHNRLRYLTQKKELLDNLSKEVERQYRELGSRYPKDMYMTLMKLIQSGESEEDKQLTSENYFVEVHYEFMQRLHIMKPELSPQELKFCCLIRANLSTKEIASILSIETRSVELRRYRLKKRLTLSKETSLTEWLLSV